MVNPARSGCWQTTTAAFVPFRARSPGPFFVGGKKKKGKWKVGKKNLLLLSRGPRKERFLGWKREKYTGKEILLRVFLGQKFEKIAPKMNKRGTNSFPSFLCTFAKVTLPPFFP